MIELKDAVRAAREAAAEYFESERIEDLRLEEFERSEDDKYWLITMGYDVIKPRLRKTVLENALNIPPTGLEYSRVYKQFVVDSESGEVTSMKVRAV